MKSNQDQQKQQVAAAAVQLIAPVLRPDIPVGVGTGSTADLFIDALAAHRGRFAGAIASSERSAERLAGHGIAVLDINEVEWLPIYVDGADEITLELAMLKGGGGALTREKIVADLADRFICIADDSKLVTRLGRFPLPVEVIPMARAQVMRALQRIAGDAAAVRVRAGPDGQPFVTDNGNLILDVCGLDVADPKALEARIDAIAGVVCNGLFATRAADILILGGSSGVRWIPEAAALEWPDLPF